ncbi:hypothetical protein ACJU26_08675 [Acidithiobacillus sp. M4-SHS-6]|uniref:hypothetical protein n=1 Tax=Acidithiobacillus sp. M4-SHS-6 TaxID=3383024 RepID=UPI0039BE3063
MAYILWGVAGFLLLMSIAGLVMAVNLSLFHAHSAEFLVLRLSAGYAVGGLLAAGGSGLLFWILGRHIRWKRG